MKTQVSPVWIQVYIYLMTPEFDMEELALDHMLVMGAKNEVETKTLNVEEMNKNAFNPFVLCQKILDGAKTSSKLQSVFGQLKLRPQNLMMLAQVQYSKCIMIMRDTVPTTETN